MAHDTTADGRYGLASGTRYTTIADAALTLAWLDFNGYLKAALYRTCLVSNRVTRANEREADRDVKDATRRLVRAARDVERQRAFEAGMEKFAAMPLRRYDSAPQPSRWIPGLHTGD